MSDKTKRKNPWLRRSIWGLSLLVLLIVVIIFVLRVLVTTDGGARFIESQINKRSFGAIEAVEISGLSGDPLNSFTIESVKISDRDGAWLTVDALEVEWNPWALRREILDLQSVTAQASQLARKPVMNTTGPSGKSPYTLQLENAAIGTFSLHEAVIGQSADFSLSGGMNTADGGGIKAILDAVRTDASGEKIHLDFIRNVAGDMEGDFDLNGPPGGTLATLLHAPIGANVTGIGRISGSLNSGQGDLVISFNKAPKINAKGNWTAAAMNLDANIKTLDWSIFDKVRSSLGNDVDIIASLNRSISPAEFETSLMSNQFKVQASGVLNPDGGAPKAVQILASSDNFGAVLPLPDGFKLGVGQIKGLIETAPTYTFTGDVEVRNVSTPYIQATSVTGPISITQDPKAQYRIDGDWTFSDLETDINFPITLAPKTKIKAKALLNPQTSQVTDITGVLSTGDNQLNLSGKANYGVLNYDLSGMTKLNLVQMGALPSGSLQSDFEVTKTVNSLLALTAIGGFKPDSAISAPFDQLLQGGVNFDLDISPIESGLRITSAKLTGDNIRAALSGRITDQFNIDGEALLSAPFTYASVSLSEETAASFTLTGNREDPNLRFDARADIVDVNGYELRDARLRTELTDISGAPKGPIRLTAETGQGNLDVKANFASREQTYVANDIALLWGALSASGNISKPSVGPATGQFSLNLPRTEDQYAEADVVLTAAGNIQGISLTADAENIAYRDWEFDRFTANASGSLSALTGELEARGQRQLDVLERQFEIKTPLNFTRSADGNFLASMNPDAKYGNIILDTATPISVNYKAGDISLNAPLILAEAPVTITYDRLSGAESFELRATDLPITVIPMPESLADTRGRIGADIKLSSNTAAAGVSGDGTITLSDWREFEVASGSGLSGDMAITVANNQLDWVLKAQSPNDFSASGNGALPIIQMSTLADLRLNMDTSLSGQFTASGQAAAILGLVTPSDAKPSGELSANLKLSGTAANPNIEGQASGQALRMEAPQLGTQLRNGRFTAQFTNDTLDVRDVSITDDGKGTITGQGQFKLGEFARPIGELKLTANNFRALDRKDYEGTISGQLDLISTQEQATLSGDVTLDRAEVKQFVRGSATVVEIEVEEINKPEGRKVISVKAPATPIDLDIKLRAPRQIFVRSRGLDVELSVDATIKGTLNDVELFGDAKVLRGSYKVAGKELAFESGSINFDGKLENARVNLIANTDTQNLSAKLSISGTVADPKIELSSTPERPQDEILSALLFGRSATELSVIEAAQLAGALAQFSGAGGGFDLMGGLRDALGVGQLSIGVNQNGGAQITGGRYLAKNVYLQIFSGGGAGQTGAVIDWEVQKNISLTSKIQADNDQSFSLKWKKDF
jgi:translocation and assembly module TamB